MIVPVFKLQIASIDTGVVAESLGGGPLETDLITGVLQKLEGQPLGIFTTRTTVEAAVSQAIQDVILDLKRDTLQAVSPEMVLTKVVNGTRRVVRNDGR